MIDVKGTKTKAQETDPAQRYALKNRDDRSKTPFVVGGLLMGLALYLKAMFPSWTRAEAYPAEKDDEEASQAAPEVALASAPDQPVEQEQAAAPSKDAPVGSGGSFMEILPSAEFVKVETRAANFLQYEPIINWDNFARHSFNPYAANDNRIGGWTIRSGGADGHPRGRDPEEPLIVEPDNTQPGGPANPQVPPAIDTECPHSCVGPEAPCDEDEEDLNASNRAPRVVAPVYLMDVTGCAILTIALSDLLRNAVDPDGDTLSVKNISVSSGTLTQSGGAWIFQGTPQIAGPVTMTYQITDGEFSVDQTAYFSVLRSQTGDSGNELLLGTLCADYIEGGDGNDNIDGRAGNDVIAGGRGNDHIVAGSGADAVFGGDGNDIIFGKAGNDHISGGAGNDRLFGDDGDDIVFGDAGDDYMSGGAGSDLLLGGGGNDTIQGDTGNDTIFGDAGDDVLYGGEGNDVVSDGEGRDVVSGGAGQDHVVAALDRADDVYDGGAGNDTLDYSATRSGVLIDLAYGTVSGSETGNDKISSFETVLGGSGDDTLFGGAACETLSGSAGNDIINGNGGNDRLDGGAGDDVLSGGDGKDMVDGGAGDDRIVGTLDCDDDAYGGGEGADTIDYSSTSEGVKIDLVQGQASGVEIGEDTITSFEIAIGGAGDDHFVAGNASAVLSGGQGNNLFEFTSRNTHSQDVPVLHEILDFKVGDRIRMSKYDLFEKVFDELEDRFEAIYGDEVDEDDVAIRYRHDRSDEIDRTIIEADFNNDDVHEVTIQLRGHHVLVVVEQA